MKSKRHILNINIILIIILANFANSRIIPLILNEDILSEAFEESAYFHVKPTIYLSNYIKVSVHGNDKNKKYAISYNKEDFSFKNRNQLSQNAYGNNFMWLNKKQVEGGFYLNIECSNNPCNYLLNITQEKDMILNLGEQYTYYVTKENEIMKFIIKGIPTLKYEMDEIESRCEYKILVYTKGNRIINTEINVESSEYKKNGFNGYIINIGEELKEVQYSFTIKGKEGDLINFGAYFFNGENICQTRINYGEEFSFLFLKNIMNFNCFIFPREEYNLLNVLNTIYLHESSVFSDNPYYINPFDENNNICCFKMNENSNYEQYFYSFQFNDFANIDTLNILPPLLLGASHYITMRKGETIGLIPNEPNNDFEYITYYTREVEGIYNASILYCKTYPFCNKDSNDIFPLIYYNSTTISYNKKEYGSNITAISNNQKILLLTCQTEFCLLYASIYTDKNKVTLVPKESFYKYIEKDKEDQFLLCMNPYLTVKLEEIHWYLNIEILNGDIDVSFHGNNYYEYKNKNKILYEIKSDINSEFFVELKANNNAIYSISTIFEKIMDNEDLFLLPQINYLLKFSKESNEKNIIINDLSKELYYINFFPLNCKTEVKKIEHIPVDISNRNENYQDFINVYEEEDSFNGYVVSVNKWDNIDECFSGLSLFRFQNNNKDINSIILAKEIYKTFLFSEKYNIVKFMFFHTETDLDVNMAINIYDKVIYNVSLLINDIFYDYYYITKNEIISIESFKIKEKCVDDKQVCKINLIISPQEFRNDSIFEIIFHTEKKRKYDNNNYLHIIIIIIALSILIGLFYICCFLKKKADYYHYLLNNFSQISINDNKNVDNNINSTEYNSKKDNFIL